SISLPRAENGEWGRRFHHVRISPDGRRVLGIFGPRGGTVEIGQPAPKLTDKLALWDAETGNLIEMHAVKMGGGILSPDEHTLLTDNRLMDAQTAKKIAELPDLFVADGWGTSRAFSLDGALIVGQAQEKRRLPNGSEVICSDGLRVWETITGKIVSRVKTES